MTPTAEAMLAMAAPRQKVAELTHQELSDRVERLRLKVGRLQHSFSEIPGMSPAEIARIDQLVDTFHSEVDDSVAAARAHETSPGEASLDIDAGLNQLIERIQFAAEASFTGG